MAPDGAMLRREASMIIGDLSLFASLARHAKDAASLAGPRTAGLPLLLLTATHGVRSMLSRISNVKCMYMNALAAESSASCCSCAAEHAPHTDTAHTHRTLTHGHGQRSASGDPQSASRYTASVSRACVRKRQPRRRTSRSLHGNAAPPCSVQEGHVQHR